MYHRHHSWQHELYPTDSWAEYPDPLPSPHPAPYTHDLLAPRLALAGSLDPATGIFYRSPEHPRLRTAQACEKCRTRKAKCSGEHPTCKRCSTRGLVCEYAKEGRVRGPNKPKSKPPQQGESSSSRKTETPPTEMAEMVVAPPTQHRRHSEGRAVRPRPSTLRLERTHHHHRAGAPHAATAPAAAAASSESGGSVPSSAVSSTFDLSPTDTVGVPGYPPGTHVHQLTHEHQQRLLDLSEFEPQQPHVRLHTAMTHLRHEPDFGIKQEHQPSLRFHETYTAPTSFTPSHQHSHPHHIHHQQYIPTSVPELDYTWPAHTQMHHYPYDVGGGGGGGDGVMGAYTDSAHAHGPPEFHS
ncbi:hypothetical protein C0995_003536 [Termitomyces sp. Mi166|nr:hypothetical protein C0995_003536 [Termitomyces sp. Mi166\